MAAQTTAEALAADFAAAIARGEPCYAAGAAAGRFELSSFLEIAQTDDGCMCSATIPAEGGVYAGGAARRDVQLPLAAILAAAASREAMQAAMRSPNSGRVWTSSAVRVQRNVFGYNLSRPRLSMVVQASALVPFRSR
mmetsp:Transcript_16481/g.51583  ORF Transcript_16481/g.51583 Transcript_16481/m.51583 type:complete len:138 (+) Transcript_16481:353-766(+)